MSGHDRGGTLPGAALDRLREVRGVALLTHPATEGTIYAALAYLFTFIEGLDVAPHAIERTVQAHDVSRRLGDAADCAQA